jgi:hypothetical protein
VLSSMVFCLDFDPFLFFSCSLAMCCSFIYLLLHWRLSCMLHIFQALKDFWRHLSLLIILSSLSAIILHSPSLQFTGLLPLIVLPCSSLSWQAFLQIYFGIIQ